MFRLSSPRAAAGFISLCSVLLFSCTNSNSSESETVQAASMNTPPQSKPVVYQVFTRLFGNTNSTNKPWGSIEENGVGKFNDFSNTALSAIRQMGVSHIWFTGVPHHATATDYTQYGIALDDPDVIKGRAGSPYAVKDYYDVDPDLAQDPAQRMAEFEALIARTHAHNMQVIIDIVPNHVARGYRSTQAPPGVASLGANDNTNTVYARDNNFYYVPGKAFQVPEQPEGFHPTGGAAHPLVDGMFDESPAKWTGNGATAAQPDANDWYETVKINYGMTAEGKTDFPTLAPGLANQDSAAHYAYWQDKQLPDSWYKMRDIALFWLAKGVDGFRFDMAEMVPVAFWSFLNSSIKHHNPDAFILAEVYQPDRYREYIQSGLMDYLYDKVGFYDSLKLVIQNQASVTTLDQAAGDVVDIESSMLHFLENHDEQRIASKPFAGSAVKGKPALAVSALKSDAPFMLYFGQEVGEDGSENMGYGQASRTTIFDYAGVPAHQRWMNEGKFDGARLTEKERSLRDYYQSVLHVAAYHPAMDSPTYSLLQYQQAARQQQTDRVYSFLRDHPHQPLIVISNFDDDEAAMTLTLPESLVTAFQLANSAGVKPQAEPLNQKQRVTPWSAYRVKNLLDRTAKITLSHQQDAVVVKVNVPAHHAVVLEVSALNAAKL
ncbi:alpha-amylase family protein [Salinimonas sediminis]